MNKSNHVIQCATRYKQSRHAVASTLDNTICLFHLQTCEYMTLNEAGSEIWRLLQQPLTLQEITGLLISVFDISADQCMSEVELWLQSAVNYGVVDVVS